MPFFKGLSRAKESGREFNMALEHFRRLSALGAGDPGRTDEACEVIRHCQLAISLSERNGDAHVLLANALAVGFQQLVDSHAPQSSIEMALEYAAAAIERWRSLRASYTKNRRTGEQLYDMLLRAVQQHRRWSRSEAEEHMAQQDARFGSWVTAVASYDSVANALTRKTAQDSPTGAVTTVLFEKLQLELRKEGVFLEESKRRVLHKWADALADEAELFWVEAFFPEMIRLLRRRYEAENCPEELWERYVAADFMRTEHMSFLDTAAQLAMGRDVTDHSWIDKYL